MMKSPRRAAFPASLKRGVWILSVKCSERFDNRPKLEIADIYSFESGPSSCVENSNFFLAGRQILGVVVNKRLSRKPRPSENVLN
jgi:hypothetical protein